MKHFELFLIGTQFVLFIIVLGNMCRLLCDYLTSKIK